MAQSIEKHSADYNEQARRANIPAQNLPLRRRYTIRSQSLRSIGLRRPRDWGSPRDRRNESVTHASHGLNEPWAVWVIAEYVTELPNRGVDPVFGIDKYFAGPEPLGDFSACNDCSFTSDEEDEKLHWFALDAYKLAIAKQFEAAAVKLEIAELKYRTGQDAGQVDLLHGGSVRQCSTQTCDFR
jgi:hypothetical protein